MKIISVILGLIGLCNIETIHNYLDKRNFIEVGKGDSASTKKFEIIKIDSINNIYQVYAKRNDSIFKIASEMEHITGCDPIRVGMFYNFKVESLLKDTPGKLHMGGVKLKTTLIKLEGGKVIWDLFVTNNLKGLCYITS